MANLNRILGAMGAAPKKVKAVDTTLRQVVTLVWDDSDSQRVFLIPSDNKTRRKLMALSGKYINMSKLDDDDPIFGLSDKIDDGKLDKYMVELPVTIDTPSTLVIAGWAP